MSDRNRTGLTPCLLAALFLMLATRSYAAGEKVILPDDRVQVFIGVMELNDQTGELQNDNGEPVDIDFSNLPTLGLEVETPYGSRDSGLEYGVNAGGGFSWKGDDTNFRGKVDDGGGTIRFNIDNSMTIAELHIGGYIRAHLGKTADFYLGAGPAVIFGSHDVEDEEEEAIPISTSNGTIILTSKDSSDITLGYYGRAGVEFDLGAGKQWGFGVRYLGGELDFDDTVGKFDIEGVQFLVTYSAWY
jgi:hypothetical protein